MASPFYRETGTEPAVFVLERLSEAGDRERFRLRERFRYEHARTGVSYVVPDDLGVFKSDLASVPFFLTWLVPRGGLHTPAALLHDAFIPSKDEPASYRPPGTVDRREADAIFRDALGELGVPFIRRWLMWAGASIPTVAAKGLRWKLLIAAEVLLLGVLGVLGTLDLVDSPLVELPFTAQGSFAYELVMLFVLLLGLAVILAPLWLHSWLAGLIIGVAVAFLALPLASLLVTYCAYWVLESAISKPKEDRGPVISDNAPGPV